MTTPFFAIENDEIENAKEAGAFLLCKRCGKEHEIQFGESEGKENKLLGFVECEGKTYLATIKGKLV